MASKEQRQLVSTHDLDEQTKEERDEKDEPCHLHGMHGGRAHDGPVAVPVVVGVSCITGGLLGERVLLSLLVLAVAARTLAEVVDVGLGVAHVAHGMQHGIQEQAHDNTHDNLEQHNREQAPNGLLVGEKHRHHLV